MKKAVYIYCDEKDLCPGAEDLLEELKAKITATKARFVFLRYRSDLVRNLEGRKKKINLLIAYKKKISEIVSVLKELGSESRPVAVLLVQFDSSEKYPEEFVLYKNQLRRSVMATVFSFDDAIPAVVAGLLGEKVGRR